jgi:hypothetical protein
LSQCEGPKHERDSIAVRVILAQHVGWYRGTRCEGIEFNNASSAAPSVREAAFSPDSMREFGGASGKRSLAGYFKVSSQNTDYKAS